MARFAVLLLLMAACNGTPVAPGGAGATVVWKNDVRIDFPDLVGGLEMMAGNLITIAADQHAVTPDQHIVIGAKIIAIDPDSGRTRWADTTLTDLVQTGDRRFYGFHFTRDGDDLIALVSNGSLGKGAVIRFSVATRRVIWQFSVNQSLYPESLSVRNSVTCFAGSGVGSDFVTCLENGKTLWSRAIQQYAPAEIEIAASSLMVLVGSTITFLNLKTGATTASFQVGYVRYGDVGIHHLASWKENQVAAFLYEGIAVFDLSSPSSQPQRFIPLVGFPRAQQIAVEGSTAYVKYDLPYPTGGDQPRADVVAAYDLASGTQLWSRTDARVDDVWKMRPMRLQGSNLLFGDLNGDIWILDAKSGVVQRHVLPTKVSGRIFQWASPLEYKSSVIVVDNVGSSPFDYYLAAIK